MIIHFLGGGKDILVVKEKCIYQKYKEDRENNSSYVRWYKWSK